MHRPELPPGGLIEPPLDENARRVLEARYQERDGAGRAVEPAPELFWRVARGVAAAESTWGGDPAAAAAELYPWIARLVFLPNSPTLMNAGRPQVGQLAACFVLPVEDTIDAIFRSVGEAARIQRTGGGTGFSFSRLRPRGDIVATTGGRASGPVSFVRVFNAATDAIHQGGVRRGANMGVLRVDHPDVLEFVDVKSDPRELRNFNLSVAATDPFMQAVQRDGEYELINPRTGQPTARRRAREVFQRIARRAWESGEPGLIFIDRVNAANPTPDLGQMESTNPCVTGETRLATQHGLVRIADLELSGSTLVCTVDERALGGERGVSTRPATPAFATRDAAEVWRVTTHDGHEIEATAWHDFFTTRGKVKLRDLRVGDELLIQSGKGQFGSEGSYALGFLMGLIAGDGCFSSRTGGQEAAIVSLWGDERRLVPRVLGLVHGLVGPRHPHHTAGSIVSESRDSEAIRSISLAKVLAAHGFTRGTKLQVPEVVWRGTEECVRGYLQGLFQADGTVNISGHRHAPTCSIRLSSSTPTLLREVQLLLSNFGVFSSLKKRREAGKRRLPDGRGGHALYDCQADHELIIDGESRDRFVREVGFAEADGRLATRYAEWARGKALSRRQSFTSHVTSIEPVGVRRVFDVTQPDRNTVIFNGIVTGQCGELPLLPYESCNLGSIDVSKLVGADGKDLDWDRLRAAVRAGIRFLDDVIEANRYPVPEIERITKHNRKVGLGVMGFADLLIALGVRYDSEAGLEWGRRLMRAIQAEAVLASQQLARERGPFPGFAASIYARRGEPPRRNATVTTIAPTGTIALIAGCSSGIEPVFALAYVRRALDGTAYLPYVHPALERVARARGFWSPGLAGQVARTGTLAGVEGVPDDVREVFRTALEIAPEWHVRMQAAFQESVENACSKTINLPASATPEDVERAYLLAYELGCKGITVYRDGSRAEQVLSVPPPAQKPAIAPLELDGPANGAAGRVCGIEGCG